MQLNRPELFKQQAFIAGQWCDEATGKRQAIYNPYNQALLGHVPVMGQVEVKLAIDKASQALVRWQAKTAEERSVLLMRWYQLILESQEDLAKIMVLEQGKPLKEARGEILYAASFIQWFAEEAKRVYGDVIPSPKASARLIVIKQAIGVCAAITPWNFPAAMIARKAAAALAAGCTMVIKPAPQTPFSALALMVLAKEAGIDDGVLSVITGDAQVIGQEFCQNPLVKKLSFTGSTAVGRLLLGQCAHDIKKVSLELGGNAPFIVFNDADIDKAVEGAIQAKFRNAGQTCVCVNRFYVQRQVATEFTEKLRFNMEKLRIGDGLEDVDIGPLINQAACDKVQSHIKDAQAKGAKLLLGGKLIKDWLFMPTLLTDVSLDSLLQKQETFGPLAAISVFDDEHQAIDWANDTEYGLAAYFYSRDLSRCFTVAEALQYGMVGVNTGLISTAVAPFGGIKASGLGREGSKYGIEEYLEIKYLHLNLT